VRKKTKPPDGPLVQWLSAPFTPDTLNPDNRTVEVVVYSGAKITQNGWEGRTLWTLSTDPKAVRLQRLNDGAPLLNAHDNHNIQNVLGVVDKAWLDNGSAKATIRFSKRIDVEPVWQDVQNGIIRNISMGLWIHQSQDITPAGASTREFLAADWEPFEVSLVPVGADPGAVVLSAETEPAQRSSVVFSPEALAFRRRLNDNYRRMLSDRSGS